MERYLNTGIKEIISAFPGIAGILNDYNIGCAPCSIGSCLLKDIVSIHGLPADKEAELMYRIEKEIYPGRDIKMPKAQRREKECARPEGINYSPPLKRLVEEHRLIKRWIALIPYVLDSLDPENKTDRNTILKGIDFIRNYADGFHHAKEEDILFGYFDKNLDIIKTMLGEHETGRGHVRAVLDAIGRKDKKEISAHLSAYAELLTEHIKKEDEILYPWMDRNLPVKQVGRLFSEFNAADAHTGEEVPLKYKNFVEEMEKIYSIKEKEAAR